jgi:hypothetical protein
MIFALVLSKEKKAVLRSFLELWRLDF